MGFEKEWGKYLFKLVKFEHKKGKGLKGRGGEGRGLEVRRKEKCIELQRMPKRDGEDMCGPRGYVPLSIEHFLLFTFLHSLSFSSHSTRGGKVLFGPS